MEAKKFYNMLSAGWKIPKVYGINSYLKVWELRYWLCKFQNEPKIPRTKISTILRAEDECLNSSRVNSSFLYYLAPFGPSTGWMMPTTLENVICFIHFRNSNANFSGNTLKVRPRNKVLPGIWVSVSPIK